MEYLIGTKGTWLVSTVSRMVVQSYSRKILVQKNSLLPDRSSKTNSNSFGWASYTLPAGCKWLYTKFFSFPDENEHFSIPPKYRLLILTIEIKLPILQLREI